MIITEAVGNFSSKNLGAIGSIAYCFYYILKGDSV